MISGIILLALFLQTTECRYNTADGGSQVEHEYSIPCVMTDLIAVDRTTNQSCYYYCEVGYEINGRQHACPGDPIPINIQGREAAESGCRVEVSMFRAYFNEEGFVGCFTSDEDE